jgi:ABC-type Na+ efflux pump permease subunit
MRDLWTIIRLEARLLFRGRGVWVAALALAALGTWMATGIREDPSAAWVDMTFTGVLSTLLLTLSTGAAVQRDHDRRVSAILFSAPISETAYVLGKYLAALALLLALSLLQLGAAILTDHFDTWRDPPAILGHSHYPALGPLPFVAAWAWLIVTPIVFGSALTLAEITLTRGQRVVAYTSIILLWVVPFLVADNGWPLLLDLTGVGLMYELPLTSNSMTAFQLSSSDHISPAVREEIMRLIRGDLPPVMPALFIWSRALFLALAAALVSLTILGVARHRRGY